MGMALSRERFVHLQLQLPLVALFPSAFFRCTNSQTQSLLQKAATVWQGQNRSRYPTSWSAPTLLGGSRRSQYNSRSSRTRTRPEHVRLAPTGSN
ncbi:hypothetical protein QBC45DRAFT_419947 [Copromyces sp. CBS 386.78]|nr:hypothetical protein QBC45DRAFT_419947 [Copromyces sp. CBS 386.78]